MATIDKYNFTKELPQEMIDLETVKPLVRALYQDRYLEDPSLKANRLDVSFFDNSQVDFAMFDRNLGYGQMFTITIRERIKPLENVGVDNLQYKTDITCGGQLDMNCKIPCGGKEPTWRQINFCLDKRYIASAQHCPLLDTFMRDVDFMDMFRQSAEAAKFAYALDVWNRLVFDGITAPHKNEDPRLAPLVGATQFWDLTGQTEDKFVDIINKAYDYMVGHWEGNFGVFGAPELAQSIDLAIAKSGIYSGTGVALNSLRLGERYHGMFSVHTLPAMLSDVPLHIVPHHADYSVGGTDLYPFYTDEGANMYVVIASRDAFAHHTIQGPTLKDSGDCERGFYEKIVQVFYGGFKTIYPEKVLVIKLKRPEAGFKSFDFCCA